LAGFGFAEKRLALEAMGIKIYGNGREWQLDVSLPKPGFPPRSSAVAAHPSVRIWGMVTGGV
jgi:hypothetical protein